MKRFLKIKFEPIHLVVLTFLLLIFIGAALLSLPISSATRAYTPFVDALFTSASAVDVTGLVVVDTGTHYSLFGQLIILLLIQIGGLGYMTLSTFFYLIIRKELPFRHRLFLTESLQETSLEQVITLAKHILASVVIIESLGALILFLRWLKPYGFITALKYGVFHSVSAFNNAGFDLMGDFQSLTAFANDAVVNVTFMLLIILGGLGFCVISELYIFFKGERLNLSLNTKIVLFTSLILIVVGALIFFFAEITNPDTVGGLEGSGKILAPFFQSVTARTAGFNTVPLQFLERTSLITLMILMFIGASPASTGGGVKTTSLALLFAFVTSSIKDKDDTEIFGRSVPRELVNKAISLIFLGAMVVIISTLILASIENIPASYLFFESVSAFGTVGLSMGITPLLSTPSKLLLSLLMFIGRVGPLSVILFFAKKKYLNKVTLPEEGVIVG